MITVHHLENSRSQRVLWLLEELGLTYEIEKYARDAKTMLAPDALKRVHPLGKSPVITDGARIVAESGAIIEYLVDRHGGGALKPADGSDDALRYRYWLHFAEGSAMPPLLMKLVFDEMARAPMPFFVKPIARAIADRVQQGYSGPAVDLHFGFVEQTLGERAYFAGDELTLADIQMYYPVEASRTRGGAQHRPNTQAWLKRVTSREAFKRAQDKGGPAVPAR
jgi:glutathione S-transferase